MRRYALTATVLMISTAACSAVLGVDDFSINPQDDSGAEIDASNDSGGGGGKVDAPITTMTDSSGGMVADTGTDGAIADGGYDAAVESGTDAGVDSGMDAGADSGVDSGPVIECTVNNDCNIKGDYFICRKTDSKCISLQSQDCSRVVGDYHNDNAIIFGSILPTTGPDLTSGVPIQDAIEVAMADFHNDGDLPPKPGTSARRPIVLVGCSDNSDDDISVRAAKHLVNNVRVPAIIGAAFSGITIKVATDVTIPAGVLLISPSATSVAITGLADNGLVWRTSPSDVIQASADIALFPQLEADIVATLTAAADGGPVRPIKVGIANKGDAYGTGLAQAISDGLMFNGKTALSQINAGNPAAGNFAAFDYGDATPDYLKAIQGITTQKPDVAFLLGTTETITEVMKGVENAWPAGTPRPFYVLADGALVAEAADIANGIPATPDAAGGGLRRRILGTVPGTSNNLFVKFQLNYNSKISDGTSPQTGGAANAYDALYNLAYSVVAADKKAITGAVLASGFAKQVDKSGGTLDVGSASNINNAFQKLQAGQGFDFNGASGPLDYDLSTGEAPSDIQIWCLPLSGGMAAAGKATSVFYNAITSALEDSTTGKPGTYAKIKSDCAF